MTIRDVPTGVLRWEDPPATNYGGHKRRASAVGERWAPTADALRANPGRWGVVIDSDTPMEGLASEIRHARFDVWLPRGAFDATSRKVGDRHLVYARYVGQAGDL